MTGIPGNTGVVDTSTAKPASKALSAYPPTLLTTRPGGASNKRAENTSAPATLSPEASATRASRFRDGTAARSLARPRSPRASPSSVAGQADR